MTQWIITAAVVLAVCLYYSAVWLWIGKDPRPGTIVTQYEPPRGISPALLRFVWRERFDDRVFWAGILSLVSKGLVIFERATTDTLVRPSAGIHQHPNLPPEEQVLLDWLRHRNKRRQAAVSLLEPDAVYAATRMAESLRNIALGTWFLENRGSVLRGSIVSVLGILVCAAPRNLEQCEALVLGFAVAAPAVLYLLLILQRLNDLLRAARWPLRAILVVRALGLLVLLFSCVAAIGLGAYVLAWMLGLHVVVAGVALTVVNLTFLGLMKAPTPEGRKLLDEIAGFREFLASVERLPMDRPDAPQPKVGLYEEYLPYAVALEVEQHWTDRFLALTGTDQASDLICGTGSLYLGMWNGKPVEFVVGPPRR